MVDGFSVTTQSDNSLLDQNLCRGLVNISSHFAPPASSFSGPARFRKGHGYGELALQCGDEALGVQAMVALLVAARTRRDRRHRRPPPPLASASCEATDRPPRLKRAILPPGRPWN